VLVDGAVGRALSAKSTMGVTMPVVRTRPLASQASARSTRRCRSQADASRGGHDAARAAMSVSRFT
jgi:hypothetical protein